MNSPGDVGEQLNIRKVPERVQVSNNRIPSQTARVILQLFGFFMVVLGVTQYVHGIFFHSSLVSIQFAASFLAFCSVFEFFTCSWLIPKDKSNVQSLNLLYRTAGTIFFLACLFLNLTHCLEDISDIKSEDHADHGNQTATIQEEQGHGHGPNYYTAYLSVADVIVKATFAASYNALSIGFVGNFVVLVAAPVLTIMLFCYAALDFHFFFDWLNHHIEPVASIMLTSVCIGIAIYSLLRKKQYLLGEGPKNFKIDEISDSVKMKNNSLEKIDHVHASCEWPEGFSVSLKAYIKVEKSDKHWVARAANNFSELKDLLHSEIKAQGAREVIVEPVFVDRDEISGFMDPICISVNCHEDNVGCCTIPKTVGEA